MNIGVLLFFKYIDFFGQNITSLAQLMGIKASWTTQNIILPLGISFYTFQTISYTLDVYHQRIKAERKFIDFALYISFFPQLIAGPIERAKDLLPQLNNLKPQISQEAIFWLVLGFFKKMVVADNLAPFIDKIFSSQHIWQSLDYVVVAYAFTLQIYADFSGYSDIAIGLALLLGVRLHHNFRQPYFATSFQEFWRRWHISLSSWLRDYVYIPLGGNATTKHIFTYRNLLITMVLGGFWHGANWTFVVWGALHGFLLIIERPFLTPRIKATGLRFLKKLWVFHWVVLGFLVFRAENLSQVGHILLDIIQLDGSMNLNGLPKLGLAFAGLLFLLDVALQKQWLLPLQGSTSNRQYWLTYLVLLGLFWAILFFGVFQGAQFIYFQF